VQSITTNQLNITNLSSGTLYDVYVRTDCNSSGYSDWIGPAQFRTAYLAPYLQNFENDYSEWEFDDLFYGKRHVSDMFNEKTLNDLSICVL